MGIPPAPQGMPQIVVIFDIDANGTVTISARHKATGKDQHITMHSLGGLLEEGIQNMVQEAKMQEQKDQEWKEFIEVRNNADNL